ncbi:LexA family transcriptional regulator [Pelistega indica]|uniref:LexA repressor n=1 Tax=Pelistega indica TaxID=1414851 RepID=V8GAG7_9BURK|nr:MULTISPECIES: transcriptional repressor LexA [Pelistega]ETD73106.1 LexA family transcriptional regulator [Pelistega indica]
MTIKLTPRQEEILHLIQSTVEKTGFPPTRAEIAKTLGFKSPNAAEDHIKALSKKGAIFLSPGASRGIRLNPDFLAANTSATSTLDKISTKVVDSIKTGIDEAASLLKDNRLLLPIIGRVAAGSPINAIEHHESTLQLDPALFSATPDYLLKVKGESMKDIGIFDGDLLAVKKTSQVRNGQIVVARIDDDVTVKRFHKTGSNIELLPENSDFSPIVVDHTSSFEIEGIAVGLIRPGVFQ